MFHFWGSQLFLLAFFSVYKVLLFSIKVRSSLFPVDVFSLFNRFSLFSRVWFGLSIYWFDKLETFAGTTRCLPASACVFLQHKAKCVLFLRC